MVSKTEIEDGFAMIVKAAVKNERCPTNISADNPSGILRSGVTSALLKDGRIRVEVYAHNYRVVEILKGPSAGKRTKAPPNKTLRPYLVLHGHP